MTSSPTLYHCMLFNLYWSVYIIYFIQSTFIVTGVEENFNISVCICKFLCPKLILFKNSYNLKKKKEFNSHCTKQRVSMAVKYRGT